MMHVQEFPERRSIMVERREMSYRFEVRALETMSDEVAITILRHEPLGSASACAITATVQELEEIQKSIVHALTMARSPASARDLDGRGQRAGDGHVQ